MRTGSTSLAKAVQPALYNEAPELAPSYYAYLERAPDGHLRELHPCESGRGWAALPTHDGLTCVVQGWPREEFETNRKDVEGAYMKGFELAPEFNDRIRAAARPASPAWRTCRAFPQAVRAGWALVGDALPQAPDHGLRHHRRVPRRRSWSPRRWTTPLAGRRPYDEAMAEYQRVRDEQAQPIYELTCEFASIEPPPPEMQGYFRAMQGNQEAMDGFVSVMAGTLPAPGVLRAR